MNGKINEPPVRLWRTPLARVSSHAGLALAVFTANCGGKPVDQSTNDGKGRFLDSPLVENWPDAQGKEALNQVECTTKRCLVIEDNSIFCSNEARAYAGGDPFRSKAKIHLSRGVYPLANKFPSKLGGLEIVLETPLGKAKLLDPKQNITVRVDRIEVESDEESPGSNREWLNIEEAVGDSTSDNSFAELFVASPVIHELWRQDHFRLGDPSNARWWYDAGRTLSLKAAGSPALLPGFSNRSLVFGPCEVRGGEDFKVVFRVSESEKIELEFSLLVSRRLTGYSAFRLNRARGKIGGQEFDVSKYFDLAIFGGGQVGNPSLPWMAVRLSRGSSPSGPCALLFSPKKLGTFDKTTPSWTIHSLSCSGEKLSLIQYSSVLAPDTLGHPS